MFGCIHFISSFYLTPKVWGGDISQPNQRVKPVQNLLDLKDQALHVSMTGDEFLHTLLFGGASTAQLCFCTG